MRLTLPPVLFCNILRRYYVDMIDQTTLGHRFLLEQFDYVPRIGWQIDPFGHSATQPTLLGAEVGFDALCAPPPPPLV